jgi:Lysyl oxidase
MPRISANEVELNYDGAGNGETLVPHGGGGFRRGALGVLIALAAGVGLLPFSMGTAVAAEPAAGKLKSVQKAVGWSGSVAPTAAPAGEIPECASTACDRFDLSVDLPRRVWHRRGGVEVSVRWSSFGDNLRLYVYRAGTRVAASDGIIATAQSVLIPQAPNGQYAVYVAYDPDSVNDVIRYEGLAEVERPPKAKPVRPLLPDLVGRPQRNTTFETPFLDFFEPLPPPGESCFPSETAEEGAQTCLRFDQVFANVGEGPLEMRFAIPRDPASEARTIRQRIYRSDGPTHFDERPAGEWEFHEFHGHYHYTGFGVSRLWATDRSGGRAGVEPVRTARKVSFCITDIEIDAWGEKGNGPRTYPTPDCLFPTESDGQNDYLVQGITAGWADVYDWYLPDQYIEVTGVPDGVYILETIADPDNTILEANESNNCGSSYVRLSNVATSPTAELLGPGPRCERRPGRGPEAHPHPLNPQHGELP